MDDPLLVNVTDGSPVCRSWCRWAVRWHRSCRSTSQWEPWTERLQRHSTPPLQPQQSASSSLESDTLSYPLCKHNLAFRTGIFTKKTKNLLNNTGTKTVVQLKFQCCFVCRYDGNANRNTQKRLKIYKISSPGSTVPESFGWKGLQLLTNSNTRNLECCL